MLHVSTYIHDEVAGSINQAFLSLSGYLKHLESLSKVRQEKDNLAHKAKVWLPINNESIWESQKSFDYTKGI